ncbi:predicted protein [Botrytis cinerea T4]|uniref:Uncharacterized protein n=1 Tax=Botryotinia fuckeliana (strain T4) TaxID=999810 RepID=G2XTP8_BOTF4|nr:predicted protein [Botrytis cinerea T4]
MGSGPAARISLRELIPEYRPPLAICRTGGDEKQGLIGQAGLPRFSLRCQIPRAGFDT